MAEEVGGLVADFVIPELVCLVAEALGNVEGQVKEMKENEEICRRVYDRVRFVNGELEKITDAETLRQNRVLFMYGTTLASFLKFLKKESKKSLLKRLASNRKVLEAIQEFHKDIDDLFKLLKLTHRIEMTQWRQHWEEDCKRKHRQMAHTLSSWQTIRAEIQYNSASLDEAMVMLGFEIKYMADKNDKEQLTLMRQVFNKVVSTPNCKVPQIPEWFVSSDDVEFDPNERFDYSDTYRGTYGKGSKVVIKLVGFRTPWACVSDFIREVNLLKRLKHPNVIELYGANHRSNPPFIVCEDATHGNFAEYFAMDEEYQMQHKDQVWHLFYEAARGLAYLHSEGVVHGDLRCNKILVGSDETAKINVASSLFVLDYPTGKTRWVHGSSTVRWKAPECLSTFESMLDSTRDSRFASDVYSLGMCIIEAFSGEPPYGIDDDEMVTESILAGEPYPRPEGFEDDEWELVQRMREYNWENRISLSSVVDELKRFADRAKDAQIATKECDRCGNDMPASSKYCIHCGSQAEDPTEGFGLITHTTLQTLCERCTGRFTIFYSVMSRMKELLTQEPYMQADLDTKVEVELVMIDLLDEIAETACWGVSSSSPWPGEPGFDAKEWTVENLQAAIELGVAQVPRRAEFVNGIQKKLSNVVSKLLPSLEQASSWIRRWRQDCEDQAVYFQALVARKLTAGELRLEERTAATLLRRVDFWLGRPGSLRMEELALMKQTRAVVLQLSADGLSNTNCGDGGGGACDERDAGSDGGGDDDADSGGIVPSNNDDTRPDDASVIPREQICFAKGQRQESTRFVHRYLGSWMGASVLMEKIRSEFRATGRSVWSVARLWTSLRHPNIQRCFGVCCDGPRFFFVCEYVSYRNLGVYLRNHRSEAWQKMLDVACALHYLHVRGVVHGGLSAPSILVGADGKAKLTGFMLSSKSSESDNVFLATDGEIPTEPVPVYSDSRWTVPELLSGETASFASDVYSLGKCIVDAVSGALPCGDKLFEEDAGGSARADSNAWRRPEALSALEWEFVSRMCCDDPMERLTMAEAVHWLARFVAVYAAFNDPDCSTSISETRAAIRREQCVDDDHAGENQQTEEDDAIRARILDRLVEDEQGPNASDGEYEDDSEDEDSYDDFDGDTGGSPGKFTLVQMACEAADRIADDLRNDAFHASQDTTSANTAGRSVREWRLDTKTSERPNFITPSLTYKPVPEWHIAREVVERVKHIGVGGFGDVYKGRWLDTEVAIKTLKQLRAICTHVHLATFSSKTVAGEPSGQASFQREVEIWYRLNHPHVINLFGACVTGKPFYVCEYAGGGDLKTFLKFPHMKDDRKEMWRMLYQVGLGLQAVHAQDVIHADLKCDNILVTVDGTAKLTDFGLSCRQSVREERQRVARSAAIPWQAPEILRRKDPEDPSFAADVYSFAMCIVEAVSGEVPWGGLHHAAVRHHVERGNLPMRPDGFESCEWRVVKRMCDRDLHTRWTLGRVLRVLRVFGGQTTNLGDLFHLVRKEH